MTSERQDTSQDVEVKQNSFFSRQPSSALSRLAFWLYLVGALSSIGGAVTIALASGAPSRDIVIAALTGLVCTVLFATRMRWLQVLSLVLGIYLCYQICTEPYVISSLMAPRTDPQGGFGHFIGVVLAIVVGLMAVCANAGVVLQNYRQGSRQTPRWLTSILSGVVGIGVGALLLGSLVQPAITTGTLYTNGVPTVHMSAGSFVQTSITIPKGAKLLLVDDVAAVHIIANGSWQNGAIVQTSEAGAPTVNNL